MNRKLIIVLGILISFSVTAEESKKSKWNGNAELGYMKTTGNTDTKSLTAKGKIINDRVKWRHTGVLEVVNKSDAGNTTAKRLFLSGKSDYKIDELSYLFFLISHEDDEFSGYQYQNNQVFGYGYTVIKKDDLTLALEAGLGARQSKPDTGSTINEAIVRGAADLNWKISKTSTFLQTLSLDVGEESTITQSLTALQLQIVGNLAAKLSYRVKHSSDVPVGFEKTDTESLITLVYQF